MNKENTYRYNGIYSAFKKKEILHYAITLMYFENIMLSEMSQSQKNVYYMLSFTCTLVRVIEFVICVMVVDRVWREGKMESY